MFSEDFNDFLKALQIHQVEYLIVGGYAFGFHAYPRYTKDVDVWVNPTPENAQRTLKAVIDFLGDCPPWLSVNDLEQPGMVVQLGFEPGRIDILTQPDGVNFNECYANRVETQIEGVRVNFISKDDLRTNKRAAGRPQDIADVSALEGNK
jgi:hypothetical protein